MTRSRIRITCKRNHNGAWRLIVGGRTTRAAFGFRGLASATLELLSTFPPGMVAVESAGPHAFDVLGPVGCVAVFPPGDGGYDDGHAPD